MKKLFIALVMAGTVPWAQSGITITPWRPIFKGVEHAIGTNTPDGSIPRLQVANCVRIDLSDPDVQLFTTPPATNLVLGSVETYTMSVSNFLKTYHLAVASDANFYNASPGGSDPSSEGVRCNVYGLQMCTGAVVSIPDSNGRYASLLFTTNKQVIINLNDRNPGVDTTGIYTAVTGFYPVLSNGVNIGADAEFNYPDPFIHQPQPRTLLGPSQDRRYMFMVTIDGRQSGYSDGATDVESAIWMQQFGAWDAINMDGGGSTAMYMADCGGNPLRLNHSSYIPQSGRERIIGSHFGVIASPLPFSNFKDLTVTPGVTTAIIRWTTDTPSSTQVEYGPTAAYGNATPLDSRLRRYHVATVTGLSPRTTYYYRAVSVAGGTTLSDGCSFTTAGAAATQTLLFDVPATWKYTTNNLDAVNWKAAGYDDSSWSGPGAGLLFVENNAAVFPRNTPLPTGAGGVVMRTYYFRRHFNFSGSKAGLTLLFSSYIDDGVVYYLNGSELYRLRMPAAPAVIQNSTGATAQPCAGMPTANDAGCADVFEVGGTLLNPLVVGDNVLAAELHNFGTGADVVFGTAVFTRRVAVTQPTLNMITEGTLATLFWNEEGYVLQRSGDLSGSNWGDLPGPITVGPVTVPLSPSTFYRLRQ